MATRTGIIEVDSEGIPHFEDVMFVPAMSKYVGCRCSLTKYFDNNNELTKDKYPFFVAYPDRIYYSERGVVQETEDGRLHVGKYLLPSTSPSGVTKGSIIDIKQIHPIYNKEVPFSGSITEYTLIDLEHREVRDSRVFFLLDTNTLIDCPTIFDRIDKDRPAIIESHVITELDGLKKAENVLTRNAAQQAHSQILEAQKQGKVKFATTRYPYLPFEEPASMDQKILAAAFLEEFLHSTVILVSSDKNMLVLASSVHLQGVTLDDFLKGNYTITGAEPAPKPMSVEEPEENLDPKQLFLGAIKKTDQVKENLQKDFAKKETEFSQLLRIDDNDFRDLLDFEEIEDSPVLLRHRQLYYFLKDSFPKSLAIMYDGVMHVLLFRKWTWQEEKDKLIKKGVTFRKHSSEEIFGTLSWINPDLACYILEQLDCPLGIIKELQGSILNKKKSVFVKTLDQLSCDLSILHFYAEYVPLTLGSILGSDSDPQAAYNYIYNEDHGLFSEYARKMKEFAHHLIDHAEYQVEDKSDDEVISILESRLKEQEEVLLQLLSLVKKYIDEVETQFGLFPFEKKYYEDFISNPNVQPYWESMLSALPTPNNQDTPKDEDPKAADVITDKLHWPSDEELLGYEDNYNTSEYFPYTIFGPAGHVKASEIKKLFEILSSEYVLDDNLETRLIFLARYSGKIIPGLVLRPLKWAMVKDREGALGYLILKTANGDYATGRFFFYYDTNGNKEVPTLVIGPYAHNWDNLGPLGSSKKSLKIKLDEFLNNY